MHACIFSLGRWKQGGKSQKLNVILGVLTSLSQSVTCESLSQNKTNKNDHEGKGWDRKMFE